MEPVDIGALVGDVQAEARRRRSAGDITPELEASVEESFTRFVPQARLRQGGERLRAVVRDLGRMSFIDPHISTASQKPYLVPVKKTIRATVGWYVGAIVGQIQEFIRGDLHALRVASDAIVSLEQRMSAIEAQLTEIQARLDGESKS